MEEEKPKAERKEIKKVAQVVEVPTQVTRVIELEDGTKIDDLELLVLIYNQQKEMLRRV